MSQQVKPPPKFCIEKAFEKGPLHLLYNYRLGHLQNKISFFQGQVDPLLEENINLKEQLIELSKLVESSTDILRNLLPTYDNPNKKLKLEMATIEEIANMIKEDWHRMEAKLADNNKSIKKLREERDHWKDLFEEQTNERARQVFELQEICKQNRISYESQIIGLNKSLQSLQAVHVEQKKQMQVDFSERVNIYKLIERQFELYRRQAKDKEEQYQKKITRLNGEIDANFLSFEETKKNIKAIYDKLMADKLSEQAEGFQMLLKMKEEEKMQILISMNEAEDQYKRRAAQKQYEITKLTERNDSYRQEVGQLKDDIWKKQLQLDRQFQDGRVREEAIARLETDKKKLMKQIEENQQEYTQQKKDLERIIASRNQELNYLKEEGNVSVQKSLAQKAALQKQLQQKQQKLRQTLINLRKKDQTWQKEIEKLREQWKSQEDAIKLKLQEQQKINKGWSDKLSLVERQQAEIIKDQAQMLRRIEEVHREQQYVLQCQYQTKISEITEKQQKQLSQMKNRHQRQMTQANINSNESLREVMANCNRRMTEQEANFLIERNQYQKQIKQRQEQVKRAEKKYIQATIAIEKIENQHRQAIKQLTAAAQQEKQRLEKEMLDQMRVFQQQMEKQEARLSSIKEQMMKEIAMLKEANAIQTIQSRFLNEISKLKEEFAERIKKNEMEYRNNEQALEQAHKTKVGQLKESFHQDLIKIAEKIQQKSTYLNQRLITGFVDSEVLGMTEEQKKEYIIGKVVEIKKGNAQKEKKISELQFGLDQAEKTIEKRIKARKEELERQRDLFAKECSQRVQSITNDCITKVAEAERDRVQHSQVMYVEFQALREHHQGILNALNKKYHQLETLFEQRPSRMEDLSKIKELTNMQMKLDIEIQSYQKKMETANEIVKYLNLQLQNYKDSYDIFGPNAQNIIGGIVGMSVIKGNNNSSNTAPSETQHILDVIKSHRHHSEAKILSEQRKQLKEPLAFRKWNETAVPAVKQLKIFQDDQSEHSAAQSRDFSEPKEDKKYSYLIVEKGSAERRNRFKTQKSEKIQHESEILINAENFIKLIKGKQEDTPPPVVRQIDSERRKSYRKRKLLKRQPTQVFDHYF